MCFWIFHDWKPVECWRSEIWQEVLFGLECRRCGRRRFEEGHHVDPDYKYRFPYEEATNWMKEETLRP